MISLRNALFIVTAALLAPSIASAEDWPQWGRTIHRNMMSPTAKGLPDSFAPGKMVARSEQVDMATTKNVKWITKLGSQVYGNPTIAGGKLFVGTNNDMPHDPKYKGDRSLIACLDVQTGKSLWQFNGPKLGAGKVGDWEYLGICSSPAVDLEAGHVYFISNLCEVVCLDIDGLADGNDGPVTDEDKYLGGSEAPIALGEGDADIIWRYNMTDELGVFPHNITSCSALLVDDVLYTATSNGVDWSHVNIVNPNAPALVALNSKTGQHVGEEAVGISKRVMHCNWSSPTWGESNGKPILIFGAGDGFCYAFDPKPAPDAQGVNIFKELWRIDCNLPTYRADEKGVARRYATPPGPSEVIGTPVYHDGRIYVVIGQDPEHGEGVGLLTCIDANTGQAVWRSDVVSRSVSTPSVGDGMVYVADYAGRVHCFDAVKGDHHWTHDTLGHIWGSTLLADGKVFIGNEDGVFTILAAGKEKKVIAEVEFDNAIYSSAIVADNVLYVATMSHLYAIENKGEVVDPK